MTELKGKPCFVISFDELSHHSWQQEQIIYYEVVNKWQSSMYVSHFGIPRQHKLRRPEEKIEDVIQSLDPKKLVQISMG